MIYIFSCLISLLLSKIAVAPNKMGSSDIKNSKNVKIIFEILSFVPLTFLSAFRLYVGTDYGAYYSIYTGVRSGSNLEPGFLFFNSLLRKFSYSPFFFFAVTSIIICGIYFVFIYKFSIDPTLSILLFVITRDFFIQ